MKDSYLAEWSVFFFWKYYNQDLNFRLHGSNHVILTPAEWLRRITAAFLRIFCSFSQYFVIILIQTSWFVYTVG